MDGKGFLIGIVVVAVGVAAGIALASYISQMRSGSGGLSY